MTNRTAYPIARLRDELALVDSKLDAPIDVFLIGGCAMGLAGLKNATKDLDMVLQNRADLMRMAKALEAAGYRRTAPVEPAYADMHVAAVYDKTETPRWDLFVEVVCGKLRLSPGMAARASLEVQPAGRLRVHRVHPTDIFIFKSITPRVADREDMEIIHTHGLDWNVVLGEMAWQSDPRRVVWTPAFVEAMEDLEARGIRVPILPQLVLLAEREVGEHHVLRHVKGGSRTLANVARVMNEDPRWVSGLVDGLLARGVLVEESGDLKIPGERAPKQPR